MKKILLFLLSVCCISVFGHLSAAYPGSSNVEISLLTAAPGEELYSVFGHSAIRVKDGKDIDIVFNYGLFDFNAPNFYLNFARGRMNYCLGVESFDRFAAAYIYENRAIREQVFETDSIERKFILQFLENNYRPENRNYLYHFFLDNCATRIRDLVFSAYEGLEIPPAEENPTYREMVYVCTQNHPWGRFGIDVALGMPTDKKTDAYEQMFLPDYMFKSFAGARYNGQSIIKETRDIFVPDRPAIQPPGLVTPGVVCCFLLLLSILFLFVKKGARVFDFTLFFVAGFTGLAIFMMWFFTDHTNTKDNLNIIWALPTHLVPAFFLLSKKRGNFIRKYFLLTGIVAVLLLISWAFLPQKLNSALIPLTIALALRAFYISRFR